MAESGANPRAEEFAADYWTESARPLVSLAFVAPLLAAYELGVLFLQRRNGADVWMRDWLEGFGFRQYFLLPLLACFILVAWHHTTQQPWRIRGGVLCGMWLESGALAVILLLMAKLQDRLLDWCSSPAAITERGGQELLSKIVAYLGAGMYEELLFRLLLISLLAWFFRGCGLNRRGALIVAIAVSSLLFALAHYNVRIPLLGWETANAHGEIFQWRSFLFRFSAGAFFGAVFAFRGFGVAVGAHALYDLLLIVWPG